VLDHATEINTTLSAGAAEPPRAVALAGSHLGFFSRWSLRVFSSAKKGLQDVMTD